MDRAKDSLTTGSELLQEPNDVVCRLTIETGSRLVEEQEKLGLSSKFDTYGEPFPSFNAQSITGETDHSIGNVLHLK